MGRWLFLDCCIESSALDFLILKIEDLERLQNVVELLAEDFLSDGSGSSGFLVLDSSVVRIIRIIDYLVHELGEFLVRVIGLLLVKKSVVFELSEGAEHSVFEGLLEELEGIANVLDSVANLLHCVLLGELRGGEGGRLSFGRDGGLIDQLLAEQSRGEKED